MVSLNVGLLGFQHVSVLFDSFFYFTDRFNRDLPFLTVFVILTVNQLCLTNTLFISLSFGTSRLATVKTANGLTLMLGCLHGKPVRFDLAWQQGWVFKI